MNKMKSYTDDLVGDEELNNEKEKLNIYLSKPFNALVDR